MTTHQTMIIKHLFHGFFFLLLFAACNPAGKKINFESFEEDVRAIISRDPEMPEQKLELLEHYIAVFKDRDTYVDHMSKKDKNFPEESVISNKQYITKTDKFFERLVKKEYTYQDLLDEIDKRVEVDKQFDEDLKPLQTKIDSICEELQARIDSAQSRQDEMRDSLDKMITFKIVSVRSDNEYYSSSVDVKIDMTNNAGKPIEAVSFVIDVKNKLGEPITEMKLQTMQRITDQKTETFTFSRYGDNSSAFTALQSLDISQIDYKASVKKINVSGEIYEQDGSGQPVLIGENFRYSGFNAHFEAKGEGSCPYLLTGSAMEKEYSELMKDKEKELQSAGGKILKAIERHEKTLVREKEADEGAEDMIEF